MHKKQECVGFMFYPCEGKRHFNYRIFTMSAKVGTESKCNKAL